VSVREGKQGKGPAPSRKSTIAKLKKTWGPDCFLCGKPFESDSEITIEHWFPQSKAYELGWDYNKVNHISNLRLAHKPCNSAKGDLIPNADGTLPARPVKQKVPKAPRPEECETCANGRLLLIGESCEDCGSGPQPRTAPKATQKKPKECSHSGADHCWMCFIGHIERKTALEVIITGE
jgi:5-methylcytosine-specific restriction endonuclease McrA